MRKALILFIMVCLCLPVYSADQWDPDSPAGSDSPSDIDDKIEENNNSLQRVMANYRQGCRLQYASAATLTVSAGELVISNSAGSIHYHTQNTAATTVTWADIDTGSEQASTTYYVYGYQDDPTNDTSIDFVISESSSAPDGITYFKKLGSFVNNSSSNITDMQNDGFFSDLGTWESKSINTTYRAMTDGFLVVYILGGVAYIYSDSSSSPTTKRAAKDAGVSYGSMCSPIKKGDYYKAYSSSSASDTAYWIPLE
jgi:hypothetical protein